MWKQYRRPCRGFEPIGVIWELQIASCAGRSRNFHDWKSWVTSAEDSTSTYSNYQFEEWLYLESGNETYPVIVLSVSAVPLTQCQTNQTNMCFTCFSARTHVGGRCIFECFGPSKSSFR